MNKKLEILVYSPLALENGRGGEISVIELASGLQNFYNITLIDTNILFGKELLSQNEIRKKLKNVSRNRKLMFATFTFFNKIFTFPYPREIINLYRHVRKKDIIYASSSTIKIDFLLIFFSILARNTKFIIGFRKPLFSEKKFSLYNLKYRISIILFSLLKKRFYFHTISYHAKKFLEHFYDANKVFHIIHGIDLKGFKEESMEKKQNHTLSCLYVGYIDAVHKGVDVLLDGIEKVIEEKRNLQIFFEFCGEGPLAPRIIELQKKFPKYIRYNGYISNEEIPEYYKRNDVFLFTSRREPFGRVMIEALASNLLILCTKTYGSIEVLKGKKFAFFLEELNSDLISEKILQIYELWKSKIELFREIQESTKFYAFQNYSFSKELEIFKELIEKIKLRQL